jgi:hypothetical protein
MGRRSGQNEKLAAVRVRTRVLRVQISKTTHTKKNPNTKHQTHRHTQHADLIMLPPQPLRLVLELPRPIDRGTASSIAINEISSLDHEVFDDSVEFAAFVALRAAQVVFRLARAELAEVLGGARDGVGVELHFDAAQGFAAEGDVEEDDGVFGGHGLVVMVGSSLRYLGYFDWWMSLAFVFLFCIWCRDLIRTSQGCILNLE